MIEAGVEVRSLLSTEVMEEVDGRLAVTDVDSNGQRYVKFWIDEFHNSPAEEQAAHHAAEEHGAERELQQPPASILAFSVCSERSAESRVPRTPEGREGLTAGHNPGYASAPHYGSPGFESGASAAQHESTSMVRLTPRLETPQNAIPQIRSGATPKIRPEDHVHKGCSLLSMEPRREWFCKGADVTSPAENEAALRELEHDPPDIRQYNDNICEERWTHFSLEEVKFPTATVDVIQRGEALAIFERDLIIHFQQISKAVALHVRSLLGG